MGIQYTNIVRDFTQAQIHSLEKFCPGNLIKRQDKIKEFGKTNRKAKSHSVNYPVS